MSNLKEARVLLGKMAEHQIRLAQLQIKLDRIISKMSPEELAALYKDIESRELRSKGAA